MSKMSDLMIEIGDRLNAGESPESIAQALEVPIAWVYEVEAEYI